MDVQKTKRESKVKRATLKERANDGEGISETASGSITKEYLVGLLTSEAFSSRFVSTLNRVKKSNMEFGFSIIKDSNSEFTHISGIKGGETSDDNILLMATEIEEVGRTYPKKKFLYFGSLHFHPSLIGEFIKPSVMDGDLEIDSELRNINKQESGCTFPLISMICLISKGKVEILAYQEPLSHNFNIKENKHVGNMIGEELREVENQEEVIRTLQQWRYKAMILTASEEGRIDKEDIRKFAEMFAFIPTFDNAK